MAAQSQRKGGRVIRVICFPRNGPQPTVGLPLIPAVPDGCRPRKVWTNNRLPLVAADCHLLFASGFPTSRAQLTNSFATGLRSRFFSVTRPIGLHVSGISIGSALSDPR
jgi:hypothetical protein